MLSWLGRLLRGTSAGASPEAERDALVRAALAQQQAGNFEQAERLYYRALAFAPASAEIHNNLGNVLRGAGRLDGAVVAFQSALALDPALAEAHFNLGLVTLQRGDAPGAKGCFREAVLQRPSFADAHLNLGFLLEEEGDHAGAIGAYRSAVAADPDLVEAHVNLGMQLLLAGQFAEGWREYEWRLRYPEYGGSGAALARWDGGPLEGRSILLDSEQGFGDAIQFLRYAPLVAERGGRVIVRCATELAGLFRGTAGIQEVVSRDAPAPSHDLHCPLPSLPLVFGTRLESIPAQVPYVRADAARAALWQARLAGAGCKVGLVWSSQSKHRTAPAKSIPLDALAPLAGVPGVRFYSLQKGEAAREAQRPPAGMPLEDLGGELRDFADTAAVMANLDLVISVDTAAAHLAGAMARPAWTLLKHAPDWRWLRARADCPWYPGMRLFRQKAPGSWDAVVEEAARALRQLAARG